jgi:hypothetical protein
MSIVSFARNTTLCWPCREGGLIIWARFKGLLSSHGDHYGIADVWELRDGNFVTLTNRQPDLPAAFELHHSEVSGVLVPWMIKRFNEGYKPERPMQGPNLWRVRSGDRIAWLGASRDGVQSEHGVLHIVDFKEDALVYGEPIEWLDDVPAFGALNESTLANTKKMCAAALTKIQSYGMPATASAGAPWSIG